MPINGLPARYRALPFLCAALGLLTLLYLFTSDTFAVRQSNSTAGDNGADAAVVAPHANDGQQAPGLPRPTTTAPDASVDGTKHETPRPGRPPSDTSKSVTSSTTVNTPSVTPQNDVRVVMVTASSGTHGFLGIPHLKDMVYENRKAYALRHGYDFMWADFSTYNISKDTPVYWNKIPVLQEAFQRYPKAEWIWWMDMDIIIMNSSLSLWDHVLSPEAMARNVALDKPIGAPGGDSGYRTPASYKYEDVNFIISADNWGMNVGNFLMRRGTWSNWLLDLWVEPLYIKQDWVFPENDGWTHMWRNHPIVREHAICTNQRALDAYPAYNKLGEHWQAGDHIIHFAGCGDHDFCPVEWNKYWEMKEQLPVPESVRDALAKGTAEIENVKKGVDLPNV